MMISPEEIAQHMLDQLNESDVLYQDVVASDIATRFGDDYVNINNNGNLAINRKVLDAFNRITGNEVVWVRSERMWRKREEYDLPGRQQP